MSYEETHAKWHAFKYMDPFAADKFYTCNHKTKTCCRPNCDVNRSNEAPDNISFVNSTDDALKQGYRLCQHCLPNLGSRSDFVEEENFVLLNLDLLLKTMKFVNESIGFVPPLLGNNDSFLTSQVMKIKNLKLKKKLLKLENMDETNNTSITLESTLSKGDMEQLKRIDMACRHITLAAQSTMFGVHFVHRLCEQDDNGNFRSEKFDQFQATSGKQVPSPNEDNEEPLWAPHVAKRGCFWMKHRKLRTKRRRGGVLGFKELAAKSRISPWHFYRTFKSMTGVTPKDYGDRCFQFLYSHKKECYRALDDPESIIINAKLANPSLVSYKNDTTASKTLHHTTHTALTTPPFEKGTTVKIEPSESEVFMSSPISSLGDRSSASSLFALKQQMGLNSMEDKATNSMPLSNSTFVDSEPIEKGSSRQSTYPLPKSSNRLQQSFQQQPSQPLYADADFSPGDIEVVYETPDTAAEEATQFKFSISGNQYMDEILNFTCEDNTFNFPNVADNYSELQKLYTNGTESLDAFEIDQPFLLKQLQLQNILEKRYLDKIFLYAEDESNLDPFSASDFGTIISD